MKKTILIVEDNDLNMRLFTDVLEVYGYRVLQARDGAPGLEMARQHRPDLILLDVQLPGVSGLDLAHQLKQDEVLREIPVIAVTALAMKGDEARIREAGCDAYLSKPVSIPKFLAAVRQYVGETEADREVRRLARSA